MNQPIIVNQEAISLVNSTSYVDVLGLSVGLTRFPGETSDAFLYRIYSMVNQDTSVSYEGLLNRLNVYLGLTPRELLKLSDSSGVFSVDVSIKGIQLSSRVETLFVPTRIVDSDNFWQWRKLSEIAADINASQTYQAFLTGNDAPSVQLAWQSNVKQVGPVEVSGTSFIFPETGVDENTVVFNIAAPNFIFTEENRAILFDTPVSSGTVMSYCYRQCPFTLIGYPASVLSLTDPQLAEAALTSDRKMIYQVREYLFRLAEKDRSYWGR